MEPLDELDTEMLHLLAGACLSHHKLDPDDPNEHPFTCTLDEGHKELHQAQGPNGEVYATWMNYEQS